MKLVLISDTHERHAQAVIPNGDVLVHAGDMTMMGDAYWLLDFNDWLSELPHPRKVVIFGNHELTCDPDHAGFRSGHAEMITAATVLNDSGCEIDGFTFWGSPITPSFGPWAFNRRRGEEIGAHWNLIPEGIDVLITHGPPSYVLDTSGPHPESPHCGCERLLMAVERVKPGVHVFGHIHGGYGQRAQGGTLFVNAALVDETYTMRNRPVEVFLNRKMISLPHAPVLTAGDAAPSSEKQSPPKEEETFLETGKQ